MLHRITRCMFVNGTKTCGLCLKKYSFVKAKDLGWYTGLMPSPKGWIGTEFVELEVPGDRAYDGDDFFALLGLIISDGYAGGTGNTKTG